MIVKKTVIITGASQGIGKAIAIHFLNHDWNVVNISRNPCDIADVLNIECDLSQTKHMEKIISKYNLIRSNQIQKICLIHNACVYSNGAIQSVKKEEMQKTCEANIVAPIILNQLIIPGMEAGSSILYIGSTLSEKAVKNCLPYVVSKHALLGLMRATAQDLENHNIHTCMICPGFTKTEMLNDHLYKTNRTTNEITNQLLIKRLINPNEIANFAYYCAENTIVNGSVFHVNLGSINQ